jgi:integrase
MLLGVFFEELYVSRGANLARAHRGTDLFGVGAKRVHPHLFRHSAVTFMLQRGMNPLLVAQMLGHTSLAMIQRVYAHLTPTDAHQALMQALRTDG